MSDVSPFGDGPFPILLDHLVSTAPILVGSPKNVADEIERWFIEGAVDGFNIHVDTLEDFSRFTD